MLTPNASIIDTEFAEHSRVHNNDNATVATVLVYMVLYILICWLSERSSLRTVTIL